MAFVRILHPQAAIRAVDKSAALVLPGVHAVLTLDDLAPVLAKRRMIRHSNSGTPLDRMWSFALADGEVSYVGETVAIVIAESRYLAEDASALVAVDYDLLPTVSDCRKAVKPGAPAVRRELNSNIVATYKISFGDAAAAFEKAAHVFHENLWQHRGAGHPIEGRGILAEIHADESITVWASTQKSHDLFQSLTALLDLEEARLRVKAPELAALWLAASIQGHRGRGRRPEDAALDQMDRGPARALHQRGAGARPVLVDRYRGLGRGQGAGLARHARSRCRRLRAAGRQHSLQLRLDDERPLYRAVAVDGRDGRGHQ
jgi:hypothetical protein